MKDVTTAVLVAGGGPAGLATATELNRYGIGCVVIEPRPEVSHKRPRAKTSSVRTMELLRRWGLADAVRAKAPLKVAWSQRVTFCESLSGNRITDFDGAFGLTTERDERFPEPGQQVPQPVVEEVLRTHLARAPGVDLRLGHAVTGLTEDGDGVTVTVRDEAGRGQQVRARYVVGCDGYAGVTRDQIGARYDGRADPRPNFNVVFRAPRLDTPLGPAVQYWTVTAATQGLVGRLDLDGTWWAIMPGIAADYGTAHAAELICGLIGTRAEHELLASDPWTARVLVADRFATRRVFLAGESAHVNPPYGGHGYNTSVGDAVNIAWKLAFVLRGWAPPALLDSYEAERRGVVEETVASAAANMRALPADLAADAAAIQRVKAPEFHNLGLVLGYSYAGSPVVQQGGGGAAVADVGRYTPSAEPGALLPHRWLPDGSSLYDQLGAGFTLVTPAGATAASVSDLSERSRALRIPLTVTAAPADYPWREFLLVRPDQHIAWRADDPAGIDLAAAVGGRRTLRQACPGAERGWRVKLHFYNLDTRDMLAISKVGNGVTRNDGRAIGVLVGLNPYIVLGSAVVGLLVGLTGAGGGALMTPMLILLFNVKPSAAISSDLVAAVVMRPVGSLVHIQKGTVNFRLVGWMCLGSVPMAFLGAYLLHVLGGGSAQQQNVEYALGAALLAGTAAMLLRYWLDRRSGQQRSGVIEAVRVRPLPTVLIGVVGGLVVGMTSVGSGSLMIVLLLFAYPVLAAGQLVGTDLTQAVPLTAAAALGALAFGHVQFGLTAAVIIGSVPAVLIGSLLSSRAPDKYIRPVITFVIFASGLKYAGVGTTALGWTLCVVLLACAAYWAIRAQPWRNGKAKAEAEPVRQREADILRR